MNDDVLFPHCIHCDGCEDTSPVHDDPCENLACDGSLPIGGAA